jgi:Tol biopolymer transport system component
VVKRKSLRRGQNISKKGDSLNKLPGLGVVFCALYCLCFLPVPLTSAQEKFTLEQIMSAPFPSDLVASPAGNKVAWVLNSKGARNIWIAETPWYKGRQLTSYAEDDVWQTKIDRSDKPALLVQTKGRSNSLHLSPDGSMLAFVNARGDHSFVGVLDLGSGGSGKQVRYLDPSVDRDSEPVWSRDGKQLAFIRTPTSREAFAFGPKRTGEPWAIRIANMQTGTSREIWKADEGQGSCFATLSATIR